MDRLDALLLFTRIVELGSFTQAANSLDLPRATATHAIKQLEARLGARLLDRTTRQVRPTLDGLAFYERCGRVLRDLDDAETSLRHVAAAPRGTLRVDMHGTHATQIVLPVIDSFRERYPGIDLVISSGDRLVDLVKEGVDCAIRSGTPRDSSLVAKRLAHMPQVICASPSYIDRHGMPCHPDELRLHQSVKFAANHSVRDYPLEVVVDGDTREFAAEGWITVSDAENYVVCARRGCGLIQLPRFHVEADLTSGKLVEVLTDWTSPALPVSVLYPYHRQLAPRVRVFVDWLTTVYADRFGALLSPH